MLPYTHFTLDERKYLQELLNKGHSMREIANILGRAPSSVSREIKRNRSMRRTSKNQGNPYCYHAWKANNDAICRRKKSKIRRLLPDTAEYNYVVEKLGLFWSPETISKCWSLHHPDARQISFSSIYRDLKQNRLATVSRKGNLRRRGKKRQTRNANYNTIHPERLIVDWPEEIKNRTRFGDLEGDTVYGGVGKGLLITMVDRHTRFLFAALVSSRDSKLVGSTIVDMLKGAPIRSISLDNGSEFAEFRSVEASLNVPIYFAEPHKPWQRGTNENTNDILRFFFPKGYNFHSLTPERLAEVVDLINHRPRKCLGYLSPCEMLEKLGVALT